MAKSFVATGGRRLTVALVAMAVIGAVDAFAGGVSKYAAVGIGVVTLGYYNTKYAEVLAEIVPAIVDRIRGVHHG